MKKTSSILCASLACSLAACASLQKMTPSYRHAQVRNQTLEQLRLSVMRFSDEYCTRVVEGVGRFQATARGPDERLRGQMWKISQCQSAYIDADGANPALNTLDIVVLATLSRMALDDTWATYGDRIDLLRKTQHQLEEEAWQLSRPLLSDAQAAQLRDIIDRWRARNPTVRSVGAIHFDEFARSIGEPAPGEEHKLGSIFAIVNFNPFAELDPAVQEIAQTRQLAERTIFYFQRMPNIVNMQAEGLPYQLAIQPETKAALASMQRASLIGSAADTLARELPSILDREREALLRQLTQELTSQSAAIGDLSDRMRSTLQAATTTADALNEMLQSLNKLSAQFAPRRSSAQESASGPPFDIRNYTEALQAATVTAERLTVLAQQIDSAAPAARQAAQEMIDRITRQILLILAVLILGTLGAALAYRFIVTRSFGKAASTA